MHLQYNMMYYRQYRDIAMFTQYNTAHATYTRCSTARAHWHHPHCPATGLQQYPAHGNCDGHMSANNHGIRILLSSCCHCRRRSGRIFHILHHRRPHPAANAGRVRGGGYYRAPRREAPAPLPPRQGLQEVSYKAVINTES